MDTESKGIERTNIHGETVWWTHMTEPVNVAENLG